MQRDTRMFRKLLIATLSSFVFFSVNVFAVGLGEIEQSSGLNQPLDAEIRILSPGDLAEYEVIASIATQSAFDKSGIDKPFFLNKIKFKTIKNSRGELVIKVTTHDAVKEPFLNFLIELNTPAQQFYREYTLLLDPPIFEDVTASTIEKTTSEAKPKQPSDNNQSNRSNAEPQAPQVSYSNDDSSHEENDEQNYDGSQYGAVSSTDTLWSIATKVRPSQNVSIHQTLVAIYRANPDAFYKGNINNLLRGKVLDIPSESVIQSVPQRAALQDVVMQNRQWRSGGARNIVDQTTSSQSDTNQESRGSRLSLGTADSDGDARGYGADKAEIEDLQNELVRTQEQSATLQAENDELRARLADIVANAEKSKGANGLVAIDDAELALLAQNEDDEPSNQNEATADDSFEADSAQSDALQSEISGEENTDEKLVTQTDSASETKPKVPYQVAKPKEKSFIDSLLDSGELLWGGIAGIVIILLVVFWRMKKRMEDDSFQDDLVASTGAGSMDTTEVFELPDVGDDMLVELDMDDDEDVQKAGGEEFDPIGEADIYIAYGKLDQAETLLLEAIEDNPIRSDYKVKLMECYAENDNKESFNKLEAEVNDAVDADEWSEQIGLLKNKAWESDSIDDSDEEEFDLPSTEDIFGDDDEDDFDIDLSDESTLDNDSQLNDKSLLNDDSDDEFGLDFGDDESLAIDDPDGIETLDELEDLNDLEGVDSLDDLDELESIDNLDELDLDGFDSEDAIIESPTPSEDIVSNDDEFSLDLNDEISEQDIEENEDEISIDIDKDMSLDIDDDFDFDEDTDESIDFGETLSDEIATKLDLARAYVDMGDIDGAKEILAEVVADGTEQQKSEAQALIDKC